MIIQGYVQAFSANAALKDAKEISNCLYLFFLQSSRLYNVLHKLSWDCYNLSGCTLYHQRTFSHCCCKIHVYICVSYARACNLKIILKSNL